MKNYTFFALIFAVTVGVVRSQQVASIEGGLTLSRSFDSGGSIQVRFSRRFAGAIDSLTWKGKEFVNSYDHGRLIQSAVSFDGLFECLNPTEAGSRADGGGQASSSKLLALQARGSDVIISTRMAYWLRPGETSASCPNTAASYDQEISREMIEKVVRFVPKREEKVLEQSIAFWVSERHEKATFEVLTGYMPMEFGSFYGLNIHDKTLISVPSGDGEQALPLIFSSSDGEYAMGIYCANSAVGKEMMELRYGRWRFPSDDVGNATVKWNCVHREAHVEGEYTFRAYVALGTLREVADTLSALGSRSGR